MKLQIKYFTINHFTEETLKLFIENMTIKQTNKKMPQNYKVIYLPVFKKISQTQLKNITKTRALYSQNSKSN